MVEQCRSMQVSAFWCSGEPDKERWEPEIEWGAHRHMQTLQLWNKTTKQNENWTIDLAIIGWQETLWIMCHLWEITVKSPSPYGPTYANAHPHTQRDTLKHTPHTHTLRFPSVKEPFVFLILASINFVLWCIWSALNQRQILIIYLKNDHMVPHPPILILGQHIKGQV